MPDTRESYVEKGIVKRKLFNIIPSLRHHSSRRQDWLVSEEKDLSLFMTFSKESQLFYDIKFEDMKSFLKYKQAFVIFLLGKHNKVLIVPFVDIFKNILERYLAKDNAVKLHIAETGAGIFFKEASEFNMKKYLNLYEQLL